MKQPFYDPTLSYEENMSDGPFGEFADSVSIDRADYNPTYSFLGSKVYTPFGIPAGPLINARFVKAAFKKGFDICVYKTVRTRFLPCHPYPNVLAVQLEGDLTLEKAQGELIATSDYAAPLSITNSFGVPSLEPAEWQPDMKTAVEAAGEGQVMVGSFQGTKSTSGNPEDLIADYVLAARLVKETGAKILEANLSCPNEGTADLLCFDVDRVEIIARRIKEEIGNTPLLMKFAYFESNEHLERLVKQVGPIIDGFSAINTIPSSILNEHGTQALPGEGRLRSGVCGAGIKWAGLDMVKRLARLREHLEMKFALVGVGGVMSVSDYKAYRQAGADAVMSATGAMWQPGLGKEIFQDEHHR